MPTAGRRMLLDEDGSEDTDAYVPSDGVGDAEKEGLKSHKSAASTSSRSTDRISATRTDTSEEGGGFLPDDDDHPTAPPQPQPARREKASLIASASAQGEKEGEKAPRSSDTIIIHQTAASSSSAAKAPSRPAAEEKEKGDFEDNNIHATITPTELAEARMLQRVYDINGNEKTGSASRGSGGIDVQTETETKDHPAGAPPRLSTTRLPKQLSVSSDDGAVEIEESSSSEAEEDEEEEEEHEDADNGSLLSSDPEDEDAEPEWLA
ncbi:MAG: hypothetical protein LQ338_006714 [Usnochroma carphineum]|nr:MAG: hypothetical protein LQ338_006714 [Usnochroma carphineum]